METPIQPKRRFVQPHAGDNWNRLAARLFPDTERRQAIENLKSWNLFLAFRPGGGGLTPTDVVFTEPPRPVGE